MNDKTTSSDFTYPVLGADVPSLDSSLDPSFLLLGPLDSLNPAYRAMYAKMLLLKGVDPIETAASFGYDFSCYRGMAQQKQAATFHLLYPTTASYCNPRSVRSWTLHAPAIRPLLAALGVTEVAYREWLKQHRTAWLAGINRPAAVMDLFPETV